jgi:hypothetical protein
MMNKEHLPPDRLNELKEGLLSGAEMISALEHIGECEQCADTLAESYGSLELLELPTDFKQAVLSAVNRQYRTAGHTPESESFSGTDLKSVSLPASLCSFFLQAQLIMVSISAARFIQICQRLI